MTEKIPEEKPDLFEEIKDHDHRKVVETIAKLPKLEADAISKKLCKHRGWTAANLRSEITALLAGEHEEESPVEILRPAENPVQGLQLAETLHALYQGHIKAGEHDYTALVLWTFLTYCYDDFDILAKLLINSPQKRCGKTTLLMLLEALVLRGLTSSGVSGASIYRVVDQFQPCMLLDEADTYMKQDEYIRGIVNAGHTRRLAFVSRMDGEPMKFTRFSTWSPMAIAGIGKQADTIMDRSVIVSMRRKMPGETVGKMGLKFYEQHRILRMQLLRWVEDHSKALRAADPAMPRSNNDRATDNWQPLFCIAEVLGGDWPKKTAAAFRAAVAQGDDDDTAILLLQDIYSIFEKSGADRMHSAEIVRKLIEMEDRPWPEYRRGFPLTPTSMAKVLAPFGIRPLQMKLGGNNRHGYMHASFQDIFRRYLPEVVTLAPPVLPAKPLPKRGKPALARDTAVAEDDKKTPTNETEPLPRYQKKKSPAKKKAAKRRKGYRGSVSEKKVDKKNGANATAETRTSTASNKKGSGLAAKTTPPANTLIDDDAMWPDNFSDNN